MRIKAVPFLSGLLLLGGMLWASDYDNRTVITFNEPVMIAGVPVVTLEPGQYVIRLMNHDHNRNIVQVFNEREDKLFTTVLAIPNYRLFPKDKTTFSFWETPRGNPPALKAWFSAGDQWGQEFVYPKGLAATIARETGEPVPTSTAETVAELDTAPVTEVTKAGEEQPLAEAFTAPAPEATAPEPAPAVVEVAVAEPAPEPAALPATGSPFFAIGLGGLMAAAAGLTLSRLAYRKS
ncbi:MAG TPA: hypothetical protein VE958_06305 [Bryobacteraceae bacterium]|jgi:hypothetical protein|nr:hypothetical protein [Bryobacteraceae bacterium]